MKKIISLLFLSSIFISACQKSNEPVPEPVKSKRVVLTYMFGDISLWEPLLTSVNQMEEDAPAKEDGTLLVYLDYSTSVTQFRSPVLLEISYDNTNSIVSRVVKTYPKDQDAGDPEVFGSVLNQVIQEYPADSYGLIMAGHGDGWITASSTPKGRSIGGSERLKGKYMDIDKLAAAIPASLHFDFIAFHACLMAEAAALYELKDKCDYVVASVETLPFLGFPYHLATKYLFIQPYADLYNFIKTTTEYYNTVDKTDVAYFTLGLYNMDKMEQLAKVVKKCMDTMPLSYDQMRDGLWKQIGNSQNDSLMMYPWPKVAPRSEIKQPFYDFWPLINMVGDYNEALAYELYYTTKDVVRIKNSVLGNMIQTDVFKDYQVFSTGLSFYIPDKKKNAESDNAFYDRFQWSKASGFTREKDSN